MTVQKQALGTSEIEISPMGVGAWAWGERLFWGYGTDYTENDVRAAFETSLRAGINFIDTAELYGFGSSERLVGKFVQSLPEKPIIATKFFPYPWRMTRMQVFAALRGSLKRLGLESVDLYQMHWYPRIVRDTLEDALADAVKEGLARTIGVSNYDLAATQHVQQKYARRGIHLASNQVEYSLLNREIEFNGLLQVCQDQGITVIAYSPIAQGLLTGKYTVSHRPAGMRRFRYKPAYLAKITPLLELIRRIGEAYGGKTPSQVALNWVMCKGAVPIPGAKNQKQAEENAGALGWRLSSEDVADLDKASRHVQMH